MRPVQSGTIGPVSPPQAMKVGDAAFLRMDRISAELFAITYGALVTELLREKGSVGVECELVKIGKSIGFRLIDEFLAKNPNLAKCSTFTQSVETLSKIGFKMFLGIDVSEFTILEENKKIVLNFSENPFTDFYIQQPPGEKFNYSSLLDGILIGAYESLNLKISVKWLQDILKGDNMNSIQIELIEIIREELGEEE